MEWSMTSISRSSQLEERGKNQVTGPDAAPLPLLSVLIPTYNRPLFLEDCLYSLLKQDYQGYEVIVRDNLSDDIEAYAQIIEKYRGLFGDRVELRYVRNSVNLGCEGNKHEGVLQDCRGKYCLIVDDDDFFVKDKVLSLYVGVFQSIEGIAVVTGDVRKLFTMSDPRSAKEIIDEAPAGSISREPLIVDGTEYFLGFWNRFGPRQCIVSMFDRELALDRGWPKVTCNDQSLHLLLAPGRKVAVFHDELAIYRIHTSKDQETSGMATVDPHHVLESHCAIADWKDIAGQYTSISRPSLFLWELKNILLKNEGTIKSLRMQGGSRLDELLALLREYSAFHYVLTKYLSPQMIRHDYHRHVRRGNLLMRPAHVLELFTRKGVSMVILGLDRVIHGRMDKLLYDSEYRFATRRKVSGLVSQTRRQG
jgi:glycosyltransferase involved in cell wall biosynthesis